MINLSITRLVHDADLSVTVDTGCEPKGKYVVDTGA